MKSIEKKQGDTIYILKISLKVVEPLIWRGLEVPADISLDKLASSILVAMGWEGSHMYCFEIGKDTFYESEDDVDEFDGMKMSTAKLNSWLFRKRQKAKFIYDFGDSWTHVIEVTSILQAVSGMRYPRCVAGERACPPEDCGGAWGYMEYMEALRNPDTAEKKEMLKWIGDDFDPEAFNLVKVDKRLGFLRGKGVKKKSG
jgi:hypothetical protein